MLERIKNFFRNLFRINNKKYLEESKEKAENVNEEHKKDFINQIIVDNSKEERALKLQRDYKAGIINEEDLSEEDFNLLSSWYKEQIEKTKESIQQYKEKIINLKVMISENN